MQEVSEQDLLAAMKAAHEAIKVHCKAQMELMEEVGSTVKREYCHEENDEDLRKAVREACYDKAYAIFGTCAGTAWAGSSGFASI